MRIEKFLVLAMIFIFLVFSVSAIGVTPGKITIDYEPGVQKHVSFKIINSENERIQVVLSKQGDLANAIDLNEREITLSPGQTEREVTYTVNIPSDLSPGSNTAQIVVLQVPNTQGTSEAFVGAAVAVITQLQINVPYPGKYAEAGLNIINAGQGEDAKFVIPVVNKGKADLVDVKAQVDIYNQLNERVDSFTTNSIQVSQGSRKELVYNWKADVPPGRYRAAVALIYDGETINLEKQFNVGVASLEIREIDVKEFNLGQIAKFDMLVENTWSEPIRGLHGQIQIFDSSGEILADFKSAQSDIQPFEKEVLSLFWDSAGFSQGVYSAAIYLNYGDVSSRQDVTFDVSQNDVRITGVGYVISSSPSSGGGSNSLVVILVTVIIVLIIANILWFMVLRKKLHKKVK